jgi:hypothetical protein
MVATTGQLLQEVFYAIRIIMHCYISYINTGLLSFLNITFITIINFGASSAVLFLFKTKFRRLDSTSVLRSPAYSVGPKRQN